MAHFLNKKTACIIPQHYRNIDLMKYLFLSIILPALLIIFTSVRLNASDNKKILVINSYHRGYNWSDEIIRGIDSVLLKLQDTDIFYEYLDTKRLNSHFYLNLLVRLFKLKYKDISFNLIIVSDDNAFILC